MQTRTWYLIDTLDDSVGASNQTENDHQWGETFDSGTAVKMCRRLIHSRANMQQEERAVGERERESEREKRESERERESER